MPDNHYMHPRLAQVYEVSDQPFPDEKTFYLSLAGKPPARVLDLGCGVGNLAHGFREAGHAVTGVDPARAMLDVARGKPDGDTIRWVHGTAQEVRLGETFDLIIMTGHAFQVLLSDDDILACLRTMATHLAPGGRIGFETRNPAIDWVGRWNARPDATWEVTAGEAVTISTHVHERSTNTIRFEHIYRFPDEALTSQSTLRFTDREELEAKMAEAGLRVQSLHGDWDLSGFDPERSPEMIYIAGHA